MSMSSADDEIWDSDGEDEVAPEYDSGGGSDGGENVDEGDDSGDRSASSSSSNDRDQGDAYAPSSNSGDADGSSEDLSEDSSDDSDNDEDHDYFDDGDTLDSDNPFRVERVVDSEEFKRCLMNFCSGECDDRIRAAQEFFVANNPYRSRGEIGRPNYSDAAESIACDHLQERLRKCTRDVIASGQVGAQMMSSLDLTHQGDEPEKGPVPMVKHRESLGPCWEELLRALAEFESIKFDSFVVQKAELTEEVANMLTDRLRGKIQQSVVLVENNLGDLGIDHVSRLIESNPTLNFLFIRDNPLAGNLRSGAVRRLGQTIGAHPSLSTVSLPGCRIGEDVTFLTSIMNSGATTIILNENEIDSRGAAVIAESLESNQSLSHLELDNNRFNDIDSIKLSQALKKNANLRCFRIRGNAFSIEGIKTMFRAVFDSSSMNAIPDCNHSCDLALFSEEDHMEEFCISSINEADGVSNRMTKMMIAMFHESKESLLRYIEGVPVELIPAVLSFIQSNLAERDERPKVILDAVNMVMRWWNMPALYARKSCERPNSDRKRKRLAPQA